MVKILFSDLIRLTGNSISDFNYLSMLVVFFLFILILRVAVCFIARSTECGVCVQLPHCYVFNQTRKYGKVKIKTTANEIISPLHANKCNGEMHKPYISICSEDADRREKNNIKTQTNPIFLKYPHFRTNEKKNALQNST